METSVPAARVIVVDDTPVNLRLLSDMLRRQGYVVQAFNNGPEALAAAKTEPPDMVLLDVSMPEMDGYEVCARLKAEPALADTPVIFISALDETGDKLKAFDVGGVDYVTKPVQYKELQARVRTHLSLRELQLALLDHNRCLEEMVEAQFHDILAAKEELSQAQIATITALSKLAESRDDHTGKHIERVQTYCRMVAMEIALRPAYRAVVTSAYIETLAQASPLHDIGKVGIADAILLKPGKLTPDEMAIMQSHTTIGAETLRRVVAQYPGNSFINIGIEIAGSHHERWDGKGYPEGLSGEGIPLSARITALADVYDALRSARTYKPAFSREDSRRIVADGGGTQFDPVLVEVFLAAEPDMYEASILLAS